MKDKKAVKKVPAKKKGLSNPKAAKGSAASTAKGGNRNAKANRPIPMKAKGARKR